MLQSIREHTQGWIAGTIITIVIITFALWGIHSYFIGNGNSNVVAEVNNIEVSKEQLTVAYERLRRQAQLQYGANYTFTSKDEVALKNKALQALIEVETLKQASLAEGFNVFSTQIDNYIENLSEFQIDGRFSLDRFKEVLSTSMLSTSEFFDLIKTSLLIEQPKLGVLFTSFATPDETNYTISLVNQEREFDYLTIPSQYLSAQSLMIPPAKIAAYYNKHKTDFMTPEQVSIEYLELSIKDLMTTIPASEQDLKNFYNENLNAYMQPMAWRLQALAMTIPDDANLTDIMKIEAEAKKIAAEWMNGANYKALSIKYPLKEKVNANEFLTLNQLPSDWHKNVNPLLKPNQFSPVFRSGNQFIILKSLAIHEPKVQAYADVLAKVQEAYLRQRAEEKLINMRDQLSSLAYEHPNSLAYVAKTLNLPIKTSEPFTKEKPGKDISQFKKIREVAFSNDVLNQKNNSDVIPVNADTIVVLRLKSHVNSNLLPLSTVSKQIEEKLKSAEAEIKVKQWVEHIKAELEQGKGIGSISEAKQLTWKKVKSIGRYSTQVESAILDTAFRLPHPKIMNKTVSYGIARLPNGYAIVALKAVMPGAAVNDQQYSVFAEQVQNSQGLLEYELYKQSKLEDANIQVVQ